LIGVLRILYLANDELEREDRLGTEMLENGEIAASYGLDGSRVAEILSAKYRDICRHAQFRFSDLIHARRATIHLRGTPVAAFQRRGFA
jgi:hypothetical protein